MVVAFGQALIGFVLLYYGAKWLVIGSSSLARSAGISPLVIGLTVVAFGTSAPEFLVSILAALRDKGNIALGNVVGSNIANIGLILGASALIRPLKCHQGLLSQEIPIMLTVTVVLILLTMDTVLTVTDGIILTAGITAFLWYNYAAITRHGRPLHLEREESLSLVQGRGKLILLIAIGIATLVGGGEALVRGSVDIARMLGVSEKFIGLTLVAVGTSLPELATSIVAAARREVDISIGNILGSNIFNILAILGITALITDIRIDGGLFESGFIIDYGVMLAFALLVIPLAHSGRTIRRIEGFLLFCLYVSYFIFLSIQG